MTIDFVMNKRASEKLDIDVGDVVNGTLQQPLLLRMVLIRDFVLCVLRRGDYKCVYLEIFV